MRGRCGLDNPEVLAPYEPGALFALTAHVRRRRCGACDLCACENTGSDAALSPRTCFDGWGDFCQELFLDSDQKTMPTPHLASSQLPSHNAAVVIRERIKEKRLFEAQFLFGLLDEDDIPAEERQALERELDGLLAVVRDLQLQANKYIAEGEYVLARKMHREMERIAVDVPGLEYGKRQVEAQDQAARKAVADPAPVPEVTRPKNEPGPEDLHSSRRSARRPLHGRIARWRAARPVDAEKSVREQPEGDLVPARPPLFAGLQEKWTAVPKGRAAALGTLIVLLVLGLLFLNMMRRTYSDRSLQAQDGNNIAIKPLSVRNGEQPATDRPEQNSINIGTLSVEDGSRQ